MKTEIIGWIGNKFDLTLLEKDLNWLKTIQGYVGFSIKEVGLLEVYPLWNREGNAQDGQYSDYVGAAQLTKLDKELSHIRKVVEDTFFLEWMKFARIFDLREGSCLLPHRDYLELENCLTRIHIPLKTNPDALYLNEISVYHMRFGEIWLHDGSLVHSVINLSSDSRLHLILDFDSDIPIQNLFKDKSTTIPKTKPMAIARKFLTYEDISDIYSLSRIISDRNIKEIVTILSKISFSKEVNPALIYDWLERIAADTGDRKIMQKSKEIKEHFLGFERKESKPEGINKQTSSFK